MNRSIVLASISAFLVALPCSANPPRFVTEREFSCKDTADAVNYYVRLGEKDATKEMTADTAKARRRDLKARRICFVCRVLFEPRGKEPLDRPVFGLLDTLPEATMPREKWPRFPIVESGSSFFLLSESYLLLGDGQSPAEYVAYCRAKGQFRKQPVPVPTREQALADLQSLRRSAAWKAMKWPDSRPGHSYSLGETEVVTYLKKQADRTPPK